MKVIAVTGGSGFIGSNFIRFLFDETGFPGRVVNIDRLTYAGNPDNIADIEARLGGERYFFFREDVGRRTVIERIFREHQVDAVVHFAAETHVDRSIYRPSAFAKANIMGTLALLEAARSVMASGRPIRFHNVSTDEVYGSLEPGETSGEEAPRRPRNPYAASKAAADHLAGSFWHTYRLPVTVSICSNNYGPFQYPEKLVPLMLLRMVAGETLPVYGDGRNERDWIHVTDHCRALWLIMRRGEPGRTYNVSGGGVTDNITIIRRLALALSASTGKPPEGYTRLVRLVRDRPGHDRRYALDGRRLERELGWRPSIGLDAGLSETVRWYLENRAWAARAMERGRFRSWAGKHYRFPGKTGPEQGAGGEVAGRKKRPPPGR